MTILKRRVLITVSGRVQGVFFRAATRREAERLGLTGWVRNLPDGAVELTAEGEAGAVDRLIRWCQSGPTLARVDRCRVEEGAPTAEYSAFTVLRDD